MTLVPQPPVRSSEAGFTLVEMLVTLALTGLLAVLLLGAIHYGVTIRERTTLRAVAFDKVVAVQDFLRDSLSLAYPQLIGDPSGQAQLDFEGGPTSIRFVAPAPQAGASGGRSHFAVVVGASNPTSLVVSIDAAPSEANGRKDVLLTNIAGLAFSYLAKPGLPDGQWLERWAPGPTLPAAIRVTVRFPPGDVRTWPELVIVPRINVDAACVLDDLTKRCRGR